MGFPRICIVGTGPSGLYLGKYLRNLLQNARIDFFEKSRSLLGLFRYGIAPDKESIKANCYNLLNPGFRYFTNIHIGVDLELEKLREHYNYVILCCGSEKPRQLPICGEKRGVFDSLDLIKYYNDTGLTSYTLKLSKELQIYEFSDTQGQSSEFRDHRRIEAHFDHLRSLGNLDIAVIGNGNVALDIARIFSRTKEQLEKLDISKKFTDFLNSVRVRKISLFGRSSLIDSKFTNSELKDIANDPDLAPYIDRNYKVEFGQGEGSRITQRKLELFRKIESNRETLNAQDKIPVEFKFNTEVTKVVNDPETDTISQVEYRYNSQEVGHLTESVPERTNLLVKCIGYDLNDLSEQLVKRVDNKQIFANGWINTRGKGDLNSTISSSLNLSKFIHHLNKAQGNEQVKEDILPYLVSRFKLANSSTSYVLSGQL